MLGLLFALAGVASPASPGVEVLAARSGLEAPALHQGTVVWTQGDLRVLGRPARGGTVSEVGRASLPASDRAWRLAAASGRMGLRVTGDGGELFGGPFGGPLTRLRSAAPGATMAAARDFWAWSGGFVTLERSAGALRVVVTDDRGQARTLALPAGAEAATLAVSETAAAVVVEEERGQGFSAVAVIDLATGTVLRRVDLALARGFDVTSLSLAEDGEMALTGETGNGADGLAWAPAGSAQFELIDIEDNFGLVQVAHGRIALVERGGLRDGVRAVVLEPRLDDGEHKILFRGPPAFQIEALDFDGEHVAWASQSCQFLAAATPAASRLTVPAGPCVRTEIAVTIFSTPRIARRNPTLPVRIRCLTSPGKRCRVDVRAYEFRGAKRIGRTRATVRRGSGSILRIPLGRAVAGRLRRGDEAFFLIRMTDPDGRTRQIGPI